MFYMEYKRAREITECCCIAIHSKCNYTGFFFSAQQCGKEKSKCQQVKFMINAFQAVLTELLRPLMN